MDKGTIKIVGMGPGREDMMTQQAIAALDAADVIVGYTVYLGLLGERFGGKKMLTTPMKQEAERCRMAFEEAMKGKNWHFGYKLAIGVDAASGVPHSVRMDPANAGDLGQVPGLVRGGDETAWADAGHAGVEGRPEVAGSEPLSGVAWHVARRRSKIATREQLDEEAAESSVRCAVEHVFHVVKDAFGLRRTRYRGLSKVSNQAFAAVAAAGCLVALRGGRPFGPPVALSSGRARVRAEKHAERQRKLAEARERREERALARARRELAAAFA